jgi:hypothetical protein
LVFHRQFFDVISKHCGSIKGAEAAICRPQAGLARACRGRS